jgi:14-3-3 protein epsilon
MINTAYSILANLTPDALDILRPVACSGQELTLDERGLFATACVKQLRYSCKIISLAECHPRLLGNKALTTTAFRRRVQAELFAKCTAIIQILNEHLIRSTQSHESLVFFRKM